MNTKIPTLPDLLGHMGMYQCPFHKGLCGADIELVGHEAPMPNVHEYDASWYNFKFKCDNGHKFNLKMYLDYEEKENYD
jgi:hypothetical protein